LVERRAPGVTIYKRALDAIEARDARIAELEKRVEVAETEATRQAARVAAMSAGIMLDKVMDDRDERIAELERARNTAIGVCEQLELRDEIGASPIFGAEAPAFRPGRKRLALRLHILLDDRQRRAAA